MLYTLTPAYAWRQEWGLKSNQNTSEECLEATGWDSALHHTLGVYTLNPESCREVLWNQR